jgi:hypothetical protein
MSNPIDTPNTSDVNKAIEKAKLDKLRAERLTKRVRGDK